jgi:hypothetical protein
MKSGNSSLTTFFKIYNSPNNRPSWSINSKEFGIELKAHFSIAVTSSSAYLLLLLSFYKGLFTSVHSMCPLNVSDITSKFRVVAMFVITDVDTLFYIKCCVYVLRTGVPNLIYLVPVSHWLPLSIERLKKMNALGGSPPC